MHDEAHTNVALMFNEAKRQEPEKDTLEDWLHENFRRQQPTRAGLLDLGRSGTY